MYDYVIVLDKTGKDDIKLVGGKGANLGELIKFGVPVPNGFAITTCSFDKLIEVNHIKDKIEQILQNIDVDDISSLMKSSRQIKEMILSSSIPTEIESKVMESYQNLIDADKHVDIQIDNHSTQGDMPLLAVRSSATAEDLPTASFAGQQSSFLNVHGRKELIESIKNCWASLFEPRAIFYRKKHGISKASIAVIIQRMINSEKSGVMFTIDPTTGNNIILIEATWGLGESIVGGEVSPDSYKVDKKKLEGKNWTSDAIIDLRISQKTKIVTYDYASNTTIKYDMPQNLVNTQVLTEDQILTLAKYGIMIEKYYKDHPQDIEFAIDKNGNIVFVQTRDITTKPNTKNKIDITNEKKVLQGIGASPGIASGIVKVVISKDDIKNIEKGDIIVTTMTSPDLVPRMNMSAAIVTDLGGRTCHAAIVSREMGIPAIVGTQYATRILQNNQKVTVDAFNGIVYNGIIDLSTAISIGDKLQKKTGNIEVPIKKITKTKIKVNVAFAHKIEEIEPKTDGVGLLRIEHMISQFGIHPARLVNQGRQEEYTQMLMDGIRPIARAFNPKPVWVRTLDARTDEFRNLIGGDDEPRESNPMLGWHGIRRSLDEPELLKAELNAIKGLHDEGLTNIQVMLPFVISVEELQKTKEICRQISQTIEKKIGIMVETPASVMIIEDLCKEGISFASFGTNDLTQLMLGIDRNNERLTHLSSVFHPSVLKSMKMVINVCNNYGVETSICGESGSLSDMARLLVRYGIKSISCNRDAIDTILMTVTEEEEEKETEKDL